MLNPITNQELDVLYQVIKQYIVDNTAGKITPANMRLVLAAMVEDSRLAKARLDALTTNQVRGSVFRVPYIVIADGLPTVPTELIPPRFRILGMDARAVNGAAEGSRADPIDFRLMYYATGNVVALVDEKPTTTATVRARWVRTSGTNEQKVASYLELPLEGIPLMAGEVYKYTFPGGETRLVEVRHDISQFQNPTPTGLDSDPYYAPYAPLRVDTGISQEYVDAADAELHLDINDLDIRVTQVENDADALDGRMDAVEARPLPPTTTTGLAEGTNLYFTAARAIAAAGLPANQQAALDANPALSAANYVPSISDIAPVIDEQLSQYSLLHFNAEEPNPAATYGPVSAKGFLAINNGAYFFSATYGSTARLYSPNPLALGTLESLRLAANAPGPLTLKAIGVGGGTVPLTVTIAPGELVVIVCLPLADGAGAQEPATPYNWCVLLRTGTGTAGNGASTPPTPAAGTGTAVIFDVERRWPILTTGTYTVSAAGATTDVCFQLILAVGCTAIALSGGQFVKLSATSFDATKENTYSFLVRYDGKIEYYITQPQ